MTDHTHSQYVEGCYRCDLSRDEVTSARITDAMVEAAAKARWDYDCAESGDTTEWDMRYPSFREFDIDAMRAALEAVLPVIIRQAKAEAWEEGANTAWERSNPVVNGASFYWRHDGDPANPYENGGQQ